MQPTISIPKHWDYLKAITNSQFASRNYLTANCELRLANCFVMANKHSDEVRYYSSDQIQTLSVADLKTKLQSEIDQHQLHIMILQQQLAAIKRGDVNG